MKVFLLSACFLLEKLLKTNFCDVLSVFNTSTRKDLYGKIVNVRQNKMVRVGREEELSPGRFLINAR